MPAFSDRFRHAWNAFFNKDPTEQFINYQDIGISSTYRPDRKRFTRGNERSIITAIYNRIAVDVSSIDIKHVRLDEDGRYIETIKSDLNSCLELEANTDQTGRAFIQDAVMSMLDEGVVAITPVETEGDPIKSDSYKIFTLRTGKVAEWYPAHVKVNLYNEWNGKREDITLPKKMVSIVENPFFSVMNEQNSTMQRLVRKLNLLDVIDEQNSSGKLDLIIQLPYTVRTPQKQKQAEARRKSIEEQLVGSKYGIAYTDGTERITQLNRAVDNNLLSQVEYLTNLLFSQLGISMAILDGTADEKELLNYNNRIIEPILSAIVDEMKRKFLTKTARTQNQSIEFFRDPFKLVPVSQISEIADKFTRNEIMTSNEVRQVIGMRPSKDPKADELRNSNISAPKEEIENIEENQNGNNLEQIKEVV